MFHETPLAGAQPVMGKGVTIAPASPAAMLTLRADRARPAIGEALSGGARAIEEGRAIGHVTSSHASPTIGRAIAMALIAEGRRRMGDTLLFPPEDGRVLRAVVSDPVFYDKEGARQNVS